MTKKSAPARILRKNVGDLTIPQEIAESLCSCGGLDGLSGSLPSNVVLGEMRDWYQACADPVRLKILCLLLVHPLCVCVIKALTGIADSKLSYHLGILKKNTLVESEQQGNYIIYRLTPAGRTFLEQELERCAAFPGGNGAGPG
jgi:ArsR family transcriptional regulator